MEAPTHARTGGTSMNGLAYWADLGLRFDVLTKTKALELTIAGHPR